MNSATTVPDFTRNEMRLMTTGYATSNPYGSVILFHPQDLMAGNTDDCFRIGIGLAKKSLKLYTKFSEADILLCSPLGLRMVIGDETEEKREYDFLASIEVLIIDKVRSGNSLSIQPSLGTHPPNAELGTSHEHSADRKFDTCASGRRHFACPALVVEASGEVLPTYDCLL